VKVPAFAAAMRYKEKIQRKKPEKKSRENKSERINPTLPQIVNVEVPES
jgi:hypothetical protein